MTFKIMKNRARLRILVGGCALWLFSCSGVLSYGQQEDAPPPATGDQGPQSMGTPPPFRANRPPLERALHVGPPGRWWDDPDFARKLQLTPEQQKKMDEIFQQSRLNLIDLMANVRKQEVIMEPLLSADQPDESKVTAQIDKVAQARAELEKANARMLLGLRRVLTLEQWKKLQVEDQQRHGPERQGPGGPGGMLGRMPGRMPPPPAGM
jgi:periplasmic protein CpxP/Spy